MLRRKQVPEVLKQSPLDIWQDEGWRSVRSPLSAMMRFERQFDRIFDRFFNDTEESFSTIPACDLKETDTHYLVSFDLPGVNKNDIQISVQNNLITVSGERKEEKAREEARGLGRELYYGSFQRSFALPSSVESEKVEAHYQDGVLYITAPKVESAKSRLIKVAEGKPKLVVDKSEEKAA